MACGSATVLAGGAAEELEPGPELVELAGDAMGDSWEGVLVVLREREREEKKKVEWLLY